MKDEAVNYKELEEENEKFDKRVCATETGRKLKLHEQRIILRAEHGERFEKA